MKKSLLILFIAFAIISCEKEPGGVTIEGSHFSVQNGIPDYVSTDTALAYIELIKNFKSEAEAIQWSRAKGYTSYLDALTSFYDTLNAITDSTKMKQFIDRNSHLVFIDESKSIQPIIDDNVYSTLCSYKGVVKIENYHLKPYRNYIIKAGLLSTFNNINYINLTEGTYAAGIDNYTVSLYRKDIYIKKSMGINQYLGTSLIEDLTNSDRRIYLRGQIVYYNLDPNTVQFVFELRV